MKSDCMAAEVVASMWGFLWYVIPASLAGTVLEVLIPGEKQSWLSRLRAIPIWAIYILIGVSFGAVLRYAFGLLHVQPLVSIDLSKTTGSKDLLTAIAAYTVFPVLPCSYMIFSIIGFTGRSTHFELFGEFTPYTTPLRS
jgi:hypothetical protein